MNLTGGSRSERSTPPGGARRLGPLRSPGDPPWKAGLGAVSSGRRGAQLAWELQTALLPGGLGQGSPPRPAWDAGAAARKRQTPEAARSLGPSQNRESWAFHSLEQGSHCKMSLAFPYEATATRKQRGTSTGPQEAALPPGCRGAATL